MRLVVAVLVGLLGFGCTKDARSVVEFADFQTSDLASSDASEEVKQVGDTGTEYTQGEEQKDVEDAEPVEQTLSEKFEAAGGIDLCKAAVYVLSPDLRLDYCDHRRDATEKEACLARRIPLQEFVTTICEASVEEAVRWNFDPLVPVHIMEREASLGRVTFNPHRQQFGVSADICELTISRSNIISREPHSRRAGVEVMVWRWGSGRTNKQPVRVLTEAEDKIVVDTCAAGEAGLFQLVPSNFRQGTPIPGTDQVLEGSHAERREQLIEDPVLNIKLGCKELAEHRDMFPEEERTDWWQWIGTYNTGSTERGDHWYAYTMKIMRTYVRACKEGWINVTGSTGLPRVRTIREVWPECLRVEEALDRYEDRNTDE